MWLNRHCPGFLYVLNARTYAIQRTTILNNYSPQARVNLTPLLGIPFETESRTLLMEQKEPPSLFFFIFVFF